MNVNHFQLLWITLFSREESYFSRKASLLQHISQQHSVYISLGSFWYNFASRGCGFPWYLSLILQTYLVFLHSCGMAAMVLCSAFLLLEQIWHLWPSNILTAVENFLQRCINKKKNPNLLHCHERLLLDLRMWLLMLGKWWDGRKKKWCGVQSGILIKFNHSVNA